MKKSAPKSTKKKTVKDASFDSDDSIERAATDVADMANALLAKTMAPKNNNVMNIADSSDSR